MLEKINFNDFLRYGFSGGAFLLAMALTRVGFDSTISGGVGLAESTGLAFVAVIVGSLIYSLHCALFQCPIAWLMTYFHDHKRPAFKLSKFLSAVFHYDSLIAKNYQRDYRRWIRRCFYPDFQRSFDKWASQVHFLYGCGWAIMIGAFIGRHLSHAVRSHVWYYCFIAAEGRTTFYGLFFVSILSLLGALIQDYALYCYDRRLMTDVLSKLPSIQEKATALSPE
jgi:hypothetical protein